MIEAQINESQQPVLASKIRAIRLDLGLSTEQFGELFSPPASDSIVSRWERNINAPNKARLKRIAELGNISVEELLTTQPSVMGRKIKEIRLSLGLSMEQFGKLFFPSASKGVVSNWENNYNMPNNDRLKQIAELGGITVAELTGGTTDIHELLKSELTYKGEVITAAQKDKISAMLDVILG